MRGNSGGWSVIDDPPFEYEQVEHTLPFHQYVPPKQVVEWDNGKELAKAGITLPADRLESVSNNGLTWVANRVGKDHRIVCAFPSWCWKGQVIPYQLGLVALRAIELEEGSTVDWRKLKYKINRKLTPALRKHSNRKRVVRTYWFGPVPRLTILHTFNACEAALADWVYYVTGVRLVIPPGYRDHGNGITDPYLGGDLVAAEDAAREWLQDTLWAGWWLAHGSREVWRTVAPEFGRDAFLRDSEAS